MGVRCSNAGRVGGLKTFGKSWHSENAAEAGIRPGGSLWRCSCQNPTQKDINQQDTHMLDCGKVKTCGKRAGLRENVEINVWPKVEYHQGLEEDGRKLPQPQATSDVKFINKIYFNSWQVETKNGLYREIWNRFDNEQDKWRGSTVYTDQDFCFHSVRY